MTDSFSLLVNEQKIPTPGFCVGKHEKRQSMVALQIAKIG